MTARMQLRPERVYLALREAALVADVSVSWMERMVASGKLDAWLVGRRGEPGRCYHLYRLDEILALKELDRR